MDKLKNFASSYANSSQEILILSPNTAILLKLENPKLLAKFSGTFRVGQYEKIRVLIEVSKQKF